MPTAGDDGVRVRIATDETCEGYLVVGIRIRVGVVSDWFWIRGQLVELPACEVSAAVV